MFFLSVCYCQFILSLLYSKAPYAFSAWRFSHLAYYPITIFVKKKKKQEATNSHVNQKIAKMKIKKIVEKSQKKYHLVQETFFKKRLQLYQ